MIVNTDADNQYRGSIPSSCAPILAGEADIVVGDRGVRSIEHFSWLKKRLQRLGQRGRARRRETTVPDATSGFRAYNREAALQVQVVSEFTYTLETIIQAGKMLIAVGHVPVRDESADARVAPVLVDVDLRASERARDLAGLHDVRAAARVPRRGGARCGRRRRSCGCASSSTSSRATATGMCSR